MEEGRDIPPSLGRHADVEQLKARVRPGDLFVVAWGGERNVQRVLGKVRKDLAEISGTLNNIEPGDLIKSLFGNRSNSKYLLVFLIKLITYN